jgi:hypothetical protein
MKDSAEVVSNGLGTHPPPASVTVADAHHAGFEIVVFARGNGVLPSFEDSSPIFGMEGIEPARAAEVFDGEADVVEKILVGVSDAAVGSAHPDGLGIEIGEDAITGFAGDESLFVLFARSDVDGEPAEMGGDAILHDSTAAAFEPEDSAIGGTNLEFLHRQSTVLDALLNGGSDDGEKLGQDDLFEGVVIRNLGEGMSEDRIRAGAVGYFAGDIFDVPGGDECGFLNGGKEVLLLLEDDVGLAAAGDVAEEEDDAIVEWTALDGEPEIERVGVEGLELSGDTVVHGTVVVMTDFRRLGSNGKLLPEVFSEELTFRTQQLLCSPIEEGEVPFAVDAGDGVGGGFEDLPELTDRCVAKKLGAFTVGDVVIVEGDALIGRIDRDIDPAIDAL